MEYFEEVFFGKIKGEKDGYAVFHDIFNSGKLFDPGKVLVGINYDNLTGYLEGTSFGKTKNELFLYNGISEKTRKGYFPNLEFEEFRRNELEKLLEDSGLNKRFFPEDIKKI